MYFFLTFLKYDTLNTSMTYPLLFSNGNANLLKSHEIDNHQNRCVLNQRQYTLI